MCRYGDALPNGDVFLYVKNPDPIDFPNIPEQEHTRIDIEGMT